MSTPRLGQPAIGSTVFAAVALGLSIHALFPAIPEAVALAARPSAGLVDSGIGGSS